MAGALPPGEMEDLCSFLLLPLLPCKLSSWRWALALPCGAWSICWRATARITQRPKARASSSLWLIRCNKSGERKSTIQTEPSVRSRNIVETQDFCYNGCRTLDDGKRDGKPMNISYQPLWNTLKERGMRKEDLRLAAGLTTNMIANMGKGKHISMETLLRICGTLDCDIADVIELKKD